MTEPLVEVVRSGFRECVHQGSLVIVDADGHPVIEMGDVHSTTFPRSSNKPLQAVALRRLGFVALSTEETAMSTASHEGERAHVRIVQSLLDRFGLTAEQLLCPPALPSNELARAHALVDGIPPSPLFMNCSGKHAAMLATCRVNEWPLADYTSADHPLQIAIGTTIADLTGEADSDIGIDGCGLPIVPVALTNLARAFGKLATAPEGTDERAVADAAREHPFLISGTGKDDDTLMREVPGFFCKSGADGVFAGAMPDGTAFAFKIADGGERARLPMAAAVLRHLGVPWSETLADCAAREVLGGGVRVGTVRSMVDFSHRN